VPFKSEKMRLAESQDRRRKLTAGQKEEIVTLYATGQHSLRSLAQQFGVSRSCVAIIVNPARAKAVSQRVKEHWQDYRPDKETRAKIMREHRRYKHDLYKKGELYAQSNQRV
jgi:transposase-like protein